MSKLIETKRAWKNKFISILSTVSTSLLLSYCYVQTASAAGDVATTGGTNIGGIAMTITQSFAGIAKLITAAAYIAGVGFALSAILKFKQHKDNPQQTTIGTPIALLFIAAALIFLPTIFGIANSTVFGNTGSAGGVSGVSG